MHGAGYVEDPLVAVPQIVRIAHGVDVGPVTRLRARFQTAAAHGRGTRNTVGTFDTRGGTQLKPTSATRRLAIYPGARSRPMLARTALYAYAVLLVLSLLLEQPIPLAIAP